MFQKIVFMTGGFILGSALVWLFFLLVPLHLGLDRIMQWMFAGGIAGVLGGYALSRTWKRR